MEFAFDLNGFTVTSGISATAGERKVAIDKSVIRRTKIKTIRVEGFCPITILAYACLAGTT
jgi:hypothetical protein